MLRGDLCFVQDGGEGGVGVAGEVSEVALGVSAGETGTRVEAEVREEAAERGVDDDGGEYGMKGAGYKPLRGEEQDLGERGLLGSPACRGDSTMPRALIRAQCVSHATPAGGDLGLK